jgi:hypothetical protein
MSVFEPSSLISWGGPTIRACQRREGIPISIGRWWPDLAARSAGMAMGIFIPLEITTVICAAQSKTQPIPIDLNTIQAFEARESLGFQEIVSLLNHRTGAKLTVGSTDKSFDEINHSLAENLQLAST